jgi:hypothetical protein
MANAGKDLDYAVMVDAVMVEVLVTMRSRVQYGSRDFIGGYPGRDV